MVTELKEPVSEAREPICVACLEELPHTLHFYVSRGVVVVVDDKEEVSDGSRD